jgi:8-oxo-dGTP diphosphatase
VAETADTRAAVDVVCGVIWSRDGRYLLARRPEGRIWSGWWEFPGGKMEAGESAAAAIRRESHEELGIRVTRADPWLRRVFDYPHAKVRLHFFHIRGWSGEPAGLEGQQLHWQLPGEACAVAPLLPANAPVLRALESPPLLPVTPPPDVPHRQALMQVASSLPRVLQGSSANRWLQVRRGDLTPAQWRDWYAICAEHGALPIANLTPEAAGSLGAEALHLSAARLATIDRRPDLRLVGASVHQRTEIEHAASLGLDYVILGSVNASRSHPGMTGLGWPAWAETALWSSLPVYAIGGLRREDLDVARAHGASGIAMIGAAWGAP